MLTDVSVIIVNWNGKRYLERCLGADFDGAELLLVDNGSTDGSVQLVRQLFPEVKVIEVGRNVGFSAANNIGARNCKGSYLLFLNNDTIVGDSAVQVMRRVFDRHEDISVVGARLEKPDGSVQSSSSRPLLSFYLEVRRIFTIHDRETVYGNGVDYDTSHFTSSVCGAALMIRRDVFEHVGGWPEDYFAYAEDSDLCRKVSNARFRIWYECEARVLHFHGGSSKHEGLLLLLRNHYIGHRSVNTYIRKHEGLAKAVCHAMLYPLDLIVLALRSLGRRLHRVFVQ